MKQVKIENSHSTGGQKEVFRTKLLAGMISLLLPFAVSSAIAATLTTYFVLPSIRTFVGIYTEGNTVHSTPAYSPNRIHEWAPSDGIGGEHGEWGISVRPETVAAMEAIWRGRNDNGEFEWMEVTGALGGHLRVRIQLDPSSFVGPVTVTWSRGNRDLEYRDFNSDGVFDMMLERISEGGIERLINAYVEYESSYIRIDLERPFNELACTVIMSNDERRTLRFENGKWSTP